MSYHANHEQMSCHLSLGSMSIAMRAQRLLQQHGISSDVIKASPSDQRNGCIYGLRVICAQYGTATRLISEHMPSVHIL